MTNKRTDKIREKYQYLLDAGIDTQTAYRMRHWGWNRIYNFLKETQTYDHDNLGNIITGDALKPYSNVLDHLYKHHNVDETKYKLQVKTKLIFKPKDDNNE